MSTKSGSLDFSMTSREAQANLPENAEEAPPLLTARLQSQTHQ